MRLYFKVIEKEGITKILFGKKENVDRMNEIHDSVFKASPGNPMGREYGKLLGYPSCCAGLKLSPYTKETNILFNRFSGTPLIFHSPCSNNCKKSIELAKKVLAAYYLFDKDIFTAVVAELKKPILKFSENLFAKFEGSSIENNKISYKSVDINVPSPIDGEEKDAEKTNFLEKLNQGDSLSFSKNSLKIFEGKTLIVDKKFASNEEYEILNIISNQL
jgi:hypothetical protein